MKRAAALAAIRAAGTTNDQTAFLRLYTENRISFPVAKKEFDAGRRFAEFVARRDAAKPA